MTVPQILGTVGRQTARILIDSVLPAGAVPAGTVVLLGPGEASSSGLTVVNLDSVAAPQSMPPASVVTFGLSPAADFRADEVHATLDGTSFTLAHDGEQRRVRLALLGEHQVTGALAAIALAHTLGEPLDQVIASLESVRELGRGRMQRLDSASGLVVVDDTVSAGPESMAAALKTLALIAAGRRSVAVLGPLDPGSDDPVAAHDRIGRLVVRLNVRKLVVVGHDARHLHHAAGLEGSWDGESVLVETPSEAYDLLRDELQSRDVVLVKGATDSGLGPLAHRLAGVTR